MNRVSRWALFSALAVLIPGAVFTSVAVTIWPVHMPVWALRVAAGGLQAGVLLTAVGASLWILRRGRS